ncbi:MAG: hypothetical protein JWQ71_571 [Pedosphaera sp.]|nr:hypothetical protein [Pedosphaera sp.]
MAGMEREEIFFRKVLGRKNFPKLLLGLPSLRCQPQHFLLPNSAGTLISEAIWIRIIGEFGASPSDLYFALRLPSWQRLAVFVKICPSKNAEKSGINQSFLGFLCSTEMALKQCASNIPFQFPLQDYSNRLTFPGPDTLLPAFLRISAMCGEIQRLVFSPDSSCTAI